MEWLEGLSCIICSGSEDEDQLLLCDGCDQACHTYCLGLSSVPEGPWFCSHCLQAQTRQRRLHTGENRQDIRRRRSYRILESDDDEIIQETEVEILSSPGRDRATTRLAQNDGAVRRSARLEMFNSSRNRRRESDVRQIENFQSNWDALRDGSMSFDDVVCVSSEEASSLNQDCSISTNDESELLCSGRGVMEIDLTSPPIAGSRQLVSMGDQSQYDGIAAGHLTPPLLNLRSRLQSSLRLQERSRITNSSPIERSTLSGFRTAGDLTFGAYVAAGRRTPASSGRRAYSNATQNSNDLFAHKTQAVLQAMMPSSSVSINPSSISPLPLRERLENRYTDLDSKTNSAIKSLEYLKNLEAPESSKACRNCGTGSFELHARSLVEQQLSLLFEPGELPEKALNNVTNSAVKFLIEKCGTGDNIEEKAGEAVDKALITLKF